MWLRPNIKTLAKERLHSYDRIRAIAILMVVGVHCLPSYDAPFIGEISSHSYNELLRTLFFTCNALFFMLSGRFNLRILDDSAYRRYYYRRIRGVLVPVLIYLLIYTLFNMYPDYYSVPNVLETYFYNSMGALSHGIFWFVFSLFGMLMVAPFLAHAFSKPSQTFQKAFFIIWLVWNVVNNFSENLSFDFSWSYPFWGFLFFFCVGGFIEDSFFNRMKTRSLLLLGVGVWLANALLAYLGWSVGAYDTSPFYGITAICLYLLILRIKPGTGSALGKCVSFIAVRSLDIYLLHWLAVLVLQPYFLPLSQISGILYHVCFTVCIFAIALVAAAVIEAVLIKPIQKLMDKVFRQKSG